MHAHHNATKSTQTSKLAQRITRRRLLRRSAIAVAASLFALPIIAACSDDDEEEAAQDGPPHDFSFVPYQGVGESGEEMQFSELFGQGRPVVLNFWAGQCPPCRAEMPDFQRVADHYEDDLTLIGIDVGVFTMLGTQDDARALLDELDIRYPAGYAVDQQPLRDYNVTGMPTTIFFTASGEMKEKHTRIVLENEMREKIDALLAAS
jgi:thiol-disulfide isomerase/thioredoxin